MRTFTVALILILSCVAPAPAQEPPGEGWRPMWLAVETAVDWETRKVAVQTPKLVVETSEPSHDALEAGLTEHILSDTAALGLLRNGIKITDEPDFWTPRLSIKTQVLAVTDSGGAHVLHMYTVHVALWTVVGLPAVPVRLRPDVQYVRTDLWRNGATGWTGEPDRLREVVRRQILEFIDAMSLDLLEANAEYESALEQWASTIE